MGNMSFLLLSRRCYQFYRTQNDATWQGEAVDEVKSTNYVISSQKQFNTTVSIVLMVTAYTTLSYQ
jgi:hypothetical protein